MPFTTEELTEMAGIFKSAILGEHGAAATNQPAVDAVSAVNAVAVRLPKFLDFNPELWFAQCEAVFELSRVTSEKTKFNHCISKLEPEVLRKVQSFIREPDENLPYTTFKTGLLKATLKPVPQRVQDVMDLRLGERRPTDLLHLMQESWPENNSNTSPVFRQLFIQKLPAPLQPALSSASCNLMDLALLADSQVASLRNLSLQAGPRVSASLTAATAYQAQEFESFDVTEGAPQDVMAARQQGQWRGQQRRPAPRRYAPLHRPGDLCWYHKRWGAQANKCHGFGCSFRRSENGPGARQQF